MKNLQYIFAATFCFFASALSASVKEPQISFYCNWFGLPPDCNPVQIAREYRRRAKLSHPDKNQKNRRENSSAMSDLNKLYAAFKKAVKTDQSDPLALLHAVQMSDFSKAVQLLEAGLNPNTDGNNSPALLEAAKLGKIQFVYLLISFKANVNSVDDEGNTPLRFALQRGDLLLAHYLVSQGARISNCTSVACELDQVTQRAAETASAVQRIVQEIVIIISGLIAGFWLVL